MKYEKDEIAEAALRLASTKSVPVPKSLEAKLRASAAEFGSEVRFSTTKGAAVGVDNVIPLSAARAKTPVWVWAGWAAAAAVVFFIVHAWKAAPRFAAPVAEPTEWRLSNAAHETVATVARANEASRGTLAVHRGVQGPGYYQVWVSDSGRERAVSVGYFQCSGSCEGQTFPVTLPAPPIRSIWLTHGENVTTELKAELAVVASGN